MALSKLTGAMPGFGTPDCRLCPAHFLAVSVNSRLLLTKLAKMASKKSLFGAVFVADDGGAAFDSLTQCPAFIDCFPDL